MRSFPFLFTVSALLAACGNEPPPPDPVLLAEAEEKVFPNITEYVTDGPLVPGIYFIVDSGYGYPRLHQSVGMPEVHWVDPSPIVTLGNFTRIYTDENMMGDREVRFDMDEVGRARWLVATALSIHKKVAIVVNDSVVSAPIVVDAIPNGRASWSPGSGSSPAEVEAFAQRLLAEKAGVAPAR